MVKKKPHVRNVLHLGSENVQKNKLIIQIVQFVALSSPEKCSLQVDILNLHCVFAPLRWIGMNAMLVYVMAAEGIFEGFLNGWYYEGTNNTLVKLRSEREPTLWFLQFS